MEVAQVLRMNGGMGDMSYANNSSLQKKVISMTMPITKEAIRKLYSSILPSCLTIADLGCSSGPNTFWVISQLINEVETINQKQHRSSSEYQVFFNDLPGNDFNAIFKSLPSFLQNLKNQLGPSLGPCLFSGVPGSFYDRLFPSNSLHFIHSSYSIHFLSQVPEGLESNKGNIYMAKTSPPAVLKAYYKQFQEDFSTFLSCRSEELVVGGCMVLTFLGRKSEDPSSEEGCYIWELLAMALNDMVSEGLVEEEKLDSFNLPKYTPSPTEVQMEIENQGLFTINCLEVSNLSWNAYEGELDISDLFVDDGYYVAKYMRAVAEPLLVSHFGEAIIDEVFSRYREIVADCMSKEKTEFTNITVSMTKKGISN